MSYRAGFQAFVQRFVNRFPEPDFRYVAAVSKTDGSSQSIFVTKHLWDELKMQDDQQLVIIYDTIKDTDLCHIKADLTFGIRLELTSDFLKKPLYLYRRPRSLSSGTRFNRRRWLEDKPKFGQLGASLAAQIYRDYNAR